MRLLFLFVCSCLNVLLLWVAARLFCPTGNLSVLLSLCEQTERAADYGKKQSWLLMKGDLNQGKRYVGVLS